MIPYDDLVAALTAWRARQGLPVAQKAAAAPPPARGRAAPAAQTAPAAPPAAARPAARSPAPVADYDDELVEDSYDSGEDYVMSLGSETAESTAIGSAPEPTPARGKRPW
ncbi:MAG TPA: hypothetical protein VHW23_05545 [Kofleriaceae bacterium]|nr:hypothetical protein [Kofleriaceae bacterium]